MKMPVRAVLATLLISSALGATAAQAQTKINLIDVGTTDPRALKDFQIAADYWDSVLTSNATVNIEVGYQQLPKGVLGETGSSYQYVPISAYSAALNAFGNSRVDAIADAALAARISSTGSVAAIVPGYLDPLAQTGINDSTRRVAPDGTGISSYLALTNANAKALGDNLGNTIDGEVLFSNQQPFDFDPTNGIAANSYDFLGTAVHEIGHALGFDSGADLFDENNGYAGDVDGYLWADALDMFRYNGSSLDWAPGDNSYFSIDGSTPFQDGYFSTGAYTGDGYQASHWLGPTNSQGNYTCSGFRGIMNPYICDGKTDAVTSLDLAAFDAIGWNTKIDAIADPNYSFSTAQMFRSFVPEPATWAMMLMGFGMIGAGLRYRRKNYRVA